MKFVNKTKNFIGKVLQLIYDYWTNFWVQNVRVQNVQGYWTTLLTPTLFALSALIRDLTCFQFSLIVVLLWDNLWTRYSKICGFQANWTKNRVNKVTAIIANPRGKLHCSTRITDLIVITDHVLVGICFLWLHTLRTDPLELNQNINSWFFLKWY